MEKHTLLIADGSEEFRLALSRALAPYYRVLGCGSGREALELLRSRKPQILVLDPTVPELDGLSLLETALQEDLHPMVLIVSRFLNDYIEEFAARLGVGYLMRKPCDIPVAVSRIRDLSRRIQAPSVTLRSNLCRCLLQLGFTTRHDGFSYLPDAVMLAARDLSQPVTKIIYPEVARLHGCSADNVERSIRTALDYAWKQGDRELWQQLFPGHRKRPTNADFITQLALMVQLDGISGIF